MHGGGLLQRASRMAWLAACAHHRFEVLLGRMQTQRLSPPGGPSLDPSLVERANLRIELRFDADHEVEQFVPVVNPLRPGFAPRPRNAGLTNIPSRCENLVVIHADFFSLRACNQNLLSRDGSRTRFGLC